MLYAYSIYFCQSSVWKRSDIFSGTATTFGYFTGTSNITHNLGIHKMCFLAATATNNGGCYLVDTSNANGPIHSSMAWTLNKEAYFGLNTACRAVCFD